MGQDEFSDFLLDSFDIFNLLGFDVQSTDIFSSRGSNEGSSHFIFGTDFINLGLDI